MKRLLIVAFALCVAVTADAQSGRKRPSSAARSKAQSTADQKTQLAKGRYRMLHLPEGRGFEEPWTLWRTKLGYELVEQWVFPAKEQAGPTVIDVSVQMVTELRPITVHIGSALQGLDCSVAVGAFVCEAEGRQTRVDMQDPYDFFSPSPWMLGNIVRRGRKIKDDKKTLRLVRVNGAGADGPILESFEAEVQFVGDDQIEVDGRKQPASIYELRSSSSFPPMLVWVAPDGVVYAVQDSNRPDQRLELVDFKRFRKM